MDYPYEYCHVGDDDWFILVNGNHYKTHTRTLNRIKLYTKIINIEFTNKYVMILLDNDCYLRTKADNRAIRFWMLFLNG